MTPPLQGQRKGLRAKYLLLLAAFVILFYLICNMYLKKKMNLTFCYHVDMQHDHVLKNMTSDLTPRVGGRLCANYLLPFCCMNHSLTFDMQHDHILKKFNYELLIQPLRPRGYRTQASNLKSRLICFMCILPLSTCEISVNVLTTEILQSLNFDLRFHLRGGKVKFNHCHAYLQALGNHGL